MVALGVDLMVARMVQPLFGKEKELVENFESVDIVDIMQDMVVEVECLMEK